MLRPSYGLLACLLVSACGQMAENPGPAVTLAPAPVLPQGPRHLALLLPLTGPRADLGQAMLKAAQLAVSAPNSPVLDIKDTGGDPSRAAAEASEAVAAGDALILGPLTTEETQAVASVAQQAGLPVLAFTSDRAAAQPGIWTLGVTPAQQIRRLIAAAHEDGRSRVAALLPDGPFGDAMAQALVEAATDAGFESPNIERGGDDAASAAASLKALAAYDERHGELESRLKAMREQTDPESRQQAAILAAQPVQPPPFDTLVLGASGDPMAAIADLLPGLDVAAPQVRILGPALWAGQAGRLGHISGAWFAALDPAGRGGFVTAYHGKYGFDPPPIADIAFDAALIGRALSQEGDFSANALTRQEGFTGVDGAMALLPDGHVRRALAVFQVVPGGGARIVSPAPSDLTTPGS